MTVDFERKGDARMTKLLGNEACGHPLAERKHGKGVTQIIKPDVREAGALKQWFERALDQVPLMNGTASRTLKQQPARTEFASVNVVCDKAGNFRGNGNCTTTPRPFGLGEPPRPFGSGAIE